MACTGKLLLYYHRCVKGVRGREKGINSACVTGAVLQKGSHRFISSTNIIFFVQVPGINIKGEEGKGSAAQHPGWATAGLGMWS